ncbi:Protein-export membrane protein SecG [Sphingomonas antarctica]|uniref:preprotein translocase subunit SecG n=1 Tax=Sphingomonas antarctica TaxID=2040274 RepID=UPI0039EB60EB
MLTFLLVVQAIVAAALVGVILMQRSEGGGLGMGGSPSGLMSARGAADFLTRATTILASVFVILCIVMAVISAHRAAPGTVDTSLKGAVSGQPTPAAQPAANKSPVPLGGQATPAPQPATPAPGNAQ